MSIFYGIENKYVDITEIAKRTLCTNGRIEIPPSDDIRPKYFGDPVCGVIKNIKIVDKNGKETIYGPDVPVSVSFDDLYNDDGIVIDINPKSYESCVWLSNNFKYVISVTSDIESFIDLKKFIHDNKCTNVNIFSYLLSTICDRVNDPLIIKTDSGIKYRTKTITVKELIYTHIYQDSSLREIPISLIKCNIKNTTGNIIEDLLYFSYYNTSLLYLSFYDEWPISDEANKIKYMFEYFDISHDGTNNIENNHVLDYLTNNTSCSLIFKPNKKKGLLVKSQMPVLIIAYNQYTYVTNMVKQIEKYTSDIIIVDNKSDYGPLLEYYENDYKYTLLKQSQNYGHIVCYNNYIRWVIGAIHIITDPDLSFNPKLPDDFINHLVNISIKYNAYKVGFALLHKADDIRKDIIWNRHTITEWENKYWIRRIPDNKYELYLAEIDTTFCLVNNTVNGPHIRIAGDYTCIHMPWHTNFKKYLKDGEYTAFMKNNRSSTWCN